VNEFARTGVFVGGAALLAVLAALVGPRSQPHALAADEGRPFYPDFKDPGAATELTVVQFDEASSSVRTFNVKKDDKGVWVIPSHGLYPADATTRMSKAATMFLDLVKERVASDKKEEHVKFGVLDPADQGVDTKGRGLRVTFKDKLGNVLCDLVVGKEIEGKTDVRYVRVPDKRHVYTCKLTGELSTKFADWIETDLLKINSWDTKKLVFDNYKVDEVQRDVVPGDKYVITKDDQSKWTLEGLDPAKEEPNEEHMRDVANALGQIKIVGVRRKPAGLTPDFKLQQGADAQTIVDSLVGAGYFPVRSGGVVSNEGELLAETPKGLRYTLRFGEIAYGEGDELTSGIAGRPPEPKPGETGPVQKPGNNRYLMVSVAFDEALLQKPTGLRLPKDEIDKRMKAREVMQAVVTAVDTWKQKHEGKLPESLAKLTEKPAEGEPLLARLEQDPWGSDYVLQAAGEGFAIVSFGDDKKEGGEGSASDVRSDQFPREDEWKRLADEWTEYDKKIEDGKKEADKLTRRFGPWYYVIDQALFTKLKPARKDLVKDKAPAPPTVPEPPANPGEPGREPAKETPVEPPQEPAKEGGNEPPKEPAKEPAKGPGG